MSINGPDVSRRGMPPFVLMTWTDVYPPSDAVKTIVRPSGDHFGGFITFPEVVSCTALDPSLLQIQISLAPERVEVKAIFLPSGEYAGQ